MTDWRKISIEQEPGLICAYTTNSRQVAYCASLHSMVLFFIYCKKKKMLFRLYRKNERKRLLLK